MFRPLVAAVLLLTLVRPGAAADADLLRLVSERLFAVADPPPGLAWPPAVHLAGKGVNAFAAAERRGEHSRPIIEVTPDLITKVVGEGTDRADRLAFVVGHELGHILCRHVLPDTDRDRTRLLQVTFTRAEELEADTTAVELMLRAGYSFRAGREAVMAMQQLGLDYSSFEGLGKDHPSWNDRMSRVDGDQTRFWKAMAAFQNGALFLTAEQYPRAVECFDRVAREFPGAAEVRANLGYARLMLYADQLGPADVRQLGIGPVVAVGFCPKDDLIRPRGMDEELWREAVADLDAALKLKPDLSLAQAHLGLAHLVRPPKGDAVQAVRLLNAAVRDSALNGSSRDSILVNLAAAFRAAGRPDDALANLDQVAGVVPPNRRDRDLSAALVFHRAALLADRPNRADRERAAGFFESYLTTASQLSPWWPPAYERYASVCQALNRTARAAAELKSNRPEHLRLVTGVTLRSGIVVNLGDRADDLAGRLGDVPAVPIVPGRRLFRARYADQGIELLVAEEVVAVFIRSPAGPHVPVRAGGLAARERGRLRVGMPVADADAVLGNGYQTCELIEPSVFYRYYRESGIAVRMDDAGRLAEVVIVQMPRR